MSTHPTAVNINDGDGKWSHLSQSAQGRRFQLLHTLFPRNVESQETLDENVSALKFIQLRTRAELQQVVCLGIVLFNLTAYVRFFVPVGCKQIIRSGAGCL